MRVLIIEDERHNAVRLTQMLKEINPAIEICEVLESVSDSIEWLGSNSSISIVFMDVRLSDGLCFEIFSKVAVLTPVIFTTAYDEYAVKAFKVNSIDYLLKPINKDELEAALSKYRQLRSLDEQQLSIQVLYEALKKDNKNYRSRFLVQKNSSFITVDVETICYVYSEFKNTYLCLNDSTIVSISMTLDDMETELNPRFFFRANRQNIIKSSSIAFIHAYFKGKLKIILNNKEQHEIIISKEKSVFFKKWLDR